MWQIKELAADFADVWQRNELVASDPSTPLGVNEWRVARKGKRGVWGRRDSHPHGMVA